MKSKIAIIAVAVLALLAACKPAEIEYVKYETEEAVPRMSAADAKKEVDAGNAILVDSRDKSAFDAERLPGAINIASNAAKESFDKLPKGKKIIVYCS
ncbi:MAG: rhodanese-like domain-containing protein [Pyrinomonadaceae bacterium]